MTLKVQTEYFTALADSFVSGSFESSFQNRFEKVQMPMTWWEFICLGLSNWDENVRENMNNFTSDQRSEMIRQSNQGKCDFWNEVHFWNRFLHYFVMEKLRLKLKIKFTMKLRERLPSAAFVLFWHKMNVWFMCAWVHAHRWCTRIDCMVPIT